MKNLIDNEWKDSSNFQIINVFNPASLDIIDTIPDSLEKDMIEAINISKESFKGWRNTSFDERVDIFGNFIKLLRNESKDIATLLSRESGLVLNESIEQVNNIEVILGAVVENAKLLLKDHDEKLNSNLELNILEPLGLIGIILSSSDVIYSFCYKVFSSLIMGNSVIIKPSELVPLSVSRLTYLLCLAGVSKGVIQIVHGKGDIVGKALTKSPFVKLVVVDGDLRTGLSIRNYTSRKLGKELFELNGNDALILCSDGDVSKAVDFTVKNRIMSGGQSSFGPKRFIIHESLKDEYLTKLFASLRNVKMGDPLDQNNHIGCLVGEARVNQVEMNVKLTVQQGAELLYGGHRYNNFFEPTVLHNVTKNMSIMKEVEVLGPVIPIITFDDLEEAIDIANNIPYGINNYVFTKNMDNIFTCMKKMESSKVIINPKISSNLFNFGGWKLSGSNSSGIEELLKTLCISKSVILESELNQLY